MCFAVADRRPASVSRSGPPDRAAWVLRLRRSRDITRTLREGRRFHSSYAVLHARRRTPVETESELPRVGIATGRRFRSAVSRNRAKRVLRESCRAALGGSAGPWDLLVKARTEVLDSTYQERIEALTGMLRAAGVVTDKEAAVT